MVNHVGPETGLDVAVAAVEVKVHASSGGEWRRPGLGRAAANNRLLLGLPGLRASAAATVRDWARTGVRVRRPEPVRVPLAADRQAHDGLTGTSRQLVFLDGGPMHGGRVALDWDVDRHRVQDADHGAFVYVDSGRTRTDALGQPARVFVAE